MASARIPRCMVIAGPNGAGKTTFAREYLPAEADFLRHYRPLADSWAVYDNSGNLPSLVEKGP